MDSSLAHYFLFAADSSSFSEAAARLGVQRQAVSRQIMRLENELGVRLFERSTARTAMTEAGAALYDLLKKLEASFDSVKRSLPQTTPVMDEFLFGYLRGEFCDESTDRILRLFQQRCPQVHVVYEWHHQSEMLPLLCAGKLNAAVTLQQGDISLRNEPGVDMETLSLRTIALMVNRRNPKVKEDARATDFLSEPLFICGRPEEPIRTSIANCRRELLKHGLPFSDIRVLPNYESVRMMVELGLGNSIQPANDSLIRNSELISYTLYEAAPILCVWRTDSAYAQRFAPCVRAIVSAERMLKAGRNYYDT